MSEAYRAAGGGGGGGGPAGSDLPAADAYGGGKNLDMKCSLALQQMRFHLSEEDMNRKSRGYLTEEDEAKAKEPGIKAWLARHQVISKTLHSPFFYAGLITLVTILLLLVAKPSFVMTAGPHPLALPDPNYLAIVLYGAAAGAVFLLIPLALSKIRTGKFDLSNGFSEKAYKDVLPSQKAGGKDLQGDNDAATTLADCARSLRSAARYY